MNSDYNCDAIFMFKIEQSMENSWNKCFIIYRMSAAQYGTIYCNSLQVVKLKMHLLQHLCVLQSWYNATSMRHAKSCHTREKNWLQGKIADLLCVSNCRLLLFNTFTLKVYYKKSLTTIMTSFSCVADGL